MFVQAKPSVSFDPSDEGGQHSCPPGRSFPLGLRRDFSGLFSPRGHSIRRWRYCVPVVHQSTFLCFLRSTSVTKFHSYYEHSDFCSAGSSRTWPMNTSLSNSEQISLIHAFSLPDHSVSTHLIDPSRRFNTLPLSATAFRLLPVEASPLIGRLADLPGRIEFVILRTDRSPPAAPHPASRTDAVAVGYRPESVCLKRTCTSLTKRAFRRTNRR